MPSDKKADQGSGSTLSEASLDALKEAKNGKARKFVMTCKGTNLVKLVVFKKGSFEKYKKEAKEAGTGQIYYGVITGKGENLSFQLSRSEGFDKSPIKSLILKSYLEDKGEFRCKPLIEIVDTTPLVLEPENNPLVAQFLALHDTIQAACDQYPDRATALATLTRQIGTHLDAEENEIAAGKLAELQTFLASLASGIDSDPAASTGADEEVELKVFSIVNSQAARLVWDKTRKQIQEELQALEKSIRKAIAAHNEDPEAEGEYIDEEVDGGVGELHRILHALDQRLIDKLDAALNAEGKKREALHKDSVLIIRDYRDFVENSSLMKRIDRNPFLPCSIKKRVDTALAALAKTI